MPRLMCVLVAVLSPLLMYAESPGCKDCAKQTKTVGVHGTEGARPYDGPCVCALYPVWDNSDTVGTGEEIAYLYYSVLTTPTTECAVTDIAYYFEYAIAYPKSCATAGPTGICENCRPFEELKRVSPSPFGGMKTTISESDGPDIVFPSRVPHPDHDQDRTQDSRPRRGITGDDREILASIKLPNLEERRIVKLMLVDVEASQIKPPILDARDFPRMCLGVGYEVKPEAGTEIPLRLDAKPIVRAKKVTEAGISALAITTADSPYVVKVEVLGHRFLVVLKQP